MSGGEGANDLPSQAQHPAGFKSSARVCVWMDSLAVAMSFGIAAVRHGISPPKDRAPLFWRKADSPF
jgi:hypothetical protein